MNLTFRQIAGLGFLAASALMAMALVFQHVYGYEPCPLCVLQRIAMISLALILLVAAIHKPVSAVLRRMYSGLALLAAGAGAAIAGRHVWLQNLPEDEVPTCGPGYDYIMEIFSVFEGLAMILSGSGECADIDWLFLGLTMPAWTLISFVIAVMLCVYVFINQTKFE